MPGFFDKIKTGAEQAKFEADRLMRVNQAQTALNNLKRDLETQVGELGRRALALYDSGALTQPELVELCQKIDQARMQVENQAAAVERIKQERAPQPGEVPAEEPAPAVAAPIPTPVAAGITCPSCHQPVAAGIRFCPNCGAAVQPPRPAQQATCPACNMPVAPDAAFCPECGARLGGGVPRPA